MAADRRVDQKVGFLEHDGEFCFCQPRGLLAHAERRKSGGLPPVLNEL